jgi:hypothetical protein
MQRKLARYVTLFGAIRVQVLSFCARRHYECSELGQLGIDWEDISKSLQHPTHCCGYGSTGITKQQQCVLPSVWLTDTVVCKPANVSLQPPVQVLTHCRMICICCGTFWQEHECSIRLESRHCVSA